MKCRVSSEAVSRLNLIRPYFRTEELVTRKCWELLGDAALMLFDPVVLHFLVAVREGLDLPVVVNTWVFGGNIDGRGYRDHSEDTGSATSLHRSGEAVDFVVRGMSAEEVRKWILEHQDLLPNITRMERGVSWIHGDVYPTQTPHEIILFNG